MLNKIMSAVMRLTVIFILLFELSFGLHLPFGLDKILRALSGGKIPFFNFGNSRESKPINSEENSKSRFSRNNSTSSDSSILEDFLKAVNETAREISHGNVLEDSLENFTAKTGEVTDSSILKYLLDLVAKNGSKSLTTSQIKDYMETNDGKIGKSSSDIALAYSFAGSSAKTLNDNFPPNSDADKNVRGPKKDGIQNKGLGRNCSVTENPLTELTNGDKCIYMSSAKTYPKVISVATFVNTFMNAINCSELLTTLFNITNAKPEQYSQFKYRFIADVFRYRFVDAKEIAAAAVRPIAKYFKVLPLQAMMSVYSNFLADFFFAEEILTSHNAKSLAQRYINSMEETAKLYGINNFNCDYHRKFEAIGEGTRIFFFSLIEPSLSETWELALYYAHEWLLAALDYGELKDLTFKEENICEKNEF